MLRDNMSTRLSNLFFAVLLVLALPFGAVARQSVHITMRTLPPVALPAFMRSFSFVSQGPGEITVTGTTFDPAFPDEEDAYGIATLRFNTSGRRLWLTPFDGHGLEDGAGAPTIDGQGNVFVTGFSEFATNAFEAVTLKYSKKGVPVWTNYFQADPYFTTGFSITDDKRGDTAVIVRTLTNNILVKFGKHGALVWQVDLGQPAGTEGLPSYVAAFDSAGNVLVSGPTPSGNLFSNAVAQTIKFNHRGVALWTNRYDNSVGERPLGIITDQQGQVFVTIASARRNDVLPNAGTITPQWVVVSYGPDGQHKWTGFIDDVPLGVSPTALTIDRRGSVYVGATIPTGEVRVVKFSKNGQLRWDKSKATSMVGPSSLRFGWVTPHQMTIYQDGVSAGVGTPEPVWSRVQLHYVEGL